MTLRPPNIRSVLRAVAAIALLIAQGCEAEPQSESAMPSFVIDYLPAGCGSSTIGPALKPHLTEADIHYRARVLSLDTSQLPREYDLTQLNELDMSLIKYMLDQSKTDRILTQDVAALGLMGKSILLALGDDPMPEFADYRELRRGLYHYYNCSRAHPVWLEDFRLIYGDYRTWPSTIIENSHPKIHPRRIRNNAEVGVFVAETIRDGEVHETEILLQGYRNDNALEFLTYLPNGQLSNRGEFRAGSHFVVAASPYACMSCHIDPVSQEFTVVFPQLDLTRDRE